ncbi:MAG: ATP-binding protein [Porticoccus sp.]|nr:ATP-binding protein [Porticoccus sp.]
MRIQNKLFLASIIGSSLLVGIMFVLMQWSVDRGMLNYINTRESLQWQSVADTLARYYSEKNNWQEFRSNHRLYLEMIHDVLPARRQHQNRPPFHDNNDYDRRDFNQRDGDKSNTPQNLPPPPPHNDPRQLPILADQNMLPLIGYRDDRVDYQSLPIRVEGKLVGHILLVKQEKITDGFELNFINQQRETLLAISLVVLLLSAITSFPMARHVVRPIKQLATAARALTQGNYQQQCNSQRRDELGELNRDFNQLSRTLGENDNNRKRWLADTSHELRTPIAIVRGELEAMLDGVRTLDEKNIRSAHQEVLHLGKLVDDLYDLSNADIGAMRYRMAEIDFNELVKDVSEQHRSLFDEHKLEMTLELKKEPITIWGDETRLSQLLSNLLTNSCKYTDAGGKLQVHLTQDESWVRLTLSDSTPGVSDQALSNLFDYLYRVENSRNRKTGGSGLGLAICQHIAQAHQGTLSAEHSSMGGIAITLALPLPSHV